MFKKSKTNPMIINEHQRFSLRKLKVGLASVLLGTSFYLASSQIQVAKADTVPDDPVQSQVSEQVTDIKTDTTDDTNKSSSTNDTDSITNTTTEPVSNINSDKESNKNSTENTNNTNQSSTHVPDVPNSSTPVDTSHTNNSTNSSETSGPLNPTQPTTTDTNTTHNGTSSKIPVTVQGQSVPDLTRTVDDLSFTYDETTDTLTISAKNGMATIPKALFDTNAGGVSVNTALFGQGVIYGAKVKHIKIEGRIDLQNNAAYGLFYGLTNLVDIVGIDNIVMNQVTDASFMYANCSSLVALDLQTQNVNNVKSMFGMFANCSSLRGLGIDDWTTSNVTEMGMMFYGCSSLRELNLLSFDTGNVTSMTCMFYGCSNLSSLNLMLFNTNQVINMASMFYGCSNLADLNISSFNTYNVATFNEMFYGCAKLTTLDLSRFDMSNAASLTNMLANMSSLKVLTLGTKVDLHLANDSNVGLNNLGMWFKKGTGTLTNPQEFYDSSTKLPTGETSKQLMEGFDKNLTGEQHVGPDTYVRGYRYHFFFTDRDFVPGTNINLVTPITMRVILTNYPDGVDPDKGLTISPTAEIKAAFQSILNRNFKPDNSVFGPNGDTDWAPTVEQSDNTDGSSTAPTENVIQMWFSHKVDTKTETVDRKLVVHYVDAKGATLSPDVIQTKTFSRTVTTDLVTNEVTEGDWTVDNPNTTEIQVPLIKGYVTDSATIPSYTLTADKDTVITKVYKQLGSYVPVDKDGKPIPGTTKIPYENDPSDPSKIKTDLPKIPGYSPSKTNTLPTDLSKDTNLVMFKDNKTIIRFIDQTNHNVEITGYDRIISSTEVGETINKPANIDTIVNELKSKGYLLTQDPLKTPVAAKEGEQILDYCFIHAIDYNFLTYHTRTQTIHYVDQDGNTVSPDHVVSQTFTVTNTKDMVTGKVMPTNSFPNGFNLDPVKNPIINGYVTTSKQVPAEILSDTSDITHTIVYQKVGSYIPVDKNGNAIPGATKTPYENDPTDASKVKSDPVLSTIDGYTPSKSVPVPTDPTKDTNVIYLKNNLTHIGFIDQDNNNQPISGVESVTSSNEIGKAITKPGNIDRIISDLLAKGYELVSDPFKTPVTATDGDQTLNYVFKHKIDDKQTDTVTRTQTIHFVDNKGNKLADDKVTNATFTRTGTKDLVTGKIVWSDWSKAQTLSEVKVQVIKGYIADKATIPSQTIDHTKDIDETVTYQPVGAFVPVDKNGNAIPGTNKVPYDNDPTDPTKIKPVIPTIDGYVPAKNPKMPTDPTKDTPVTYLESNQTIISFVDQDNNNQEISGVNSITSSNEIGKTISKPTQISQILADLAAKGYELVSDPFKNPVTAIDGKQNLQYVFKHKADNTQTETVTRKQTIHFVDGNGNKLADDKVTDAKFTRTGTKDLVTGTIVWSDWSEAQTLPEVKVQVIKGYVADKSTIAAQTIDNTKDIDETVTYKAVGGYIPVDKNGKTIPGTNKVPYENDPNDATKIKPIVPTIDGYVPGKGTTVPDDPAKDTTVTYLENNQTIISFVDQDDESKSIHESVTTSTDIGKTINKPATIDQIVADLIAKGYELVSDPFKNPVTATEGQQNLKYVFKHKVDNLQTETITRKQIIHFVDGNGNKLADDKVTEVKFTRTGTKDLVTGKIVWSDWSKAQTLPEVKVPVVKGYVANKATIAGQTIDNTKDLESTVTYQKLGSYIPVDKDGKVITGSNKIPYENDPNDPTKIKSTQTLPTLNGYVTPNAPVPTDVTKDTNVVYTAVTTNTGGSTGTTTKPTDQVPDKPTEPTKPADDGHEKPTEPPVIPTRPTKPNKPKTPVKPNKGHTDKSDKPQQVLGGKHSVYPAAAINAKAIKNAADVILPQTGSESPNTTNALALIGLGMALLSLSIPVKPKYKK